MSQRELSNEKQMMPGEIETGLTCRGICSYTNDVARGPEYCQAPPRAKSRGAE
jgi:hypothetical protein